ncbi:MAG: sporulation protein YabP [Eubacteriales bacterium]|jgi:sporulation protein YabP|nr:sporulation protein YabP [Bacillota bacterium]MBV1727949.1 sporulation protein YabP [Desulforudis sp.]MDQ7789115.1 sporulation protein YabP [Clostridia bacterium]MDZ4042238.1 sporulation protein YabP [Eubacteriales bacterium]MBU4554924.1 sporulation protein YabP [Bacillota bacterium]
MEAEVTHRMEMLERKLLRIEGVQHVESFTDEEIAIDTNMGFLLLAGEGLHITQLNLDAGTLVVEGYLNGIQYREAGSRQGRRGKRILNRLLR